eukprot:TRINITY_DN4969_c0_g1_i1.p1 TRINITY_DN4969_c0_g1~~TRINITY_DN4969_c0_g1_i1.p1  ORF type:complete len:785 (-),score=44.74 TRINITY_DN4969_c0_g1_i1:99-2453(-)
MSEIAGGQASASTALHVAIAEGHPNRAIFELIDGNREALNEVDKAGYPPLVYCVKSSKRFIPTAGKANNREVAERLLAAGANPNFLYNGCPFVVLLARQDAISWVELFLRHGADPNATDADTGDSVLIALLKSASDECKRGGLMVLRSYDVDFMKPDKQGVTPASLAIGHVLRDFVAAFPDAKQTLTQDTLVQLIPERCVIPSADKQDLQFAVTLLERASVPLLLQKILTVDRDCDVLYAFLRNAIAVRQDTPILELLTIPNSGGQPIFHLFPRWLRAENAIASLLAWLSAEGVDVLAPDASGTTLLDVVLKRDPKVQVFQTTIPLMMQIRPQILPKHPQLLQRYPAVFVPEHPHEVVSPHDAESSFSLLSLPSDAVRIIVLRCDLRDIFALMRTCKSLLMTLRSDQFLWNLVSSAYVPLRTQASSDTENGVKIVSEINRRTGAWMARRKWKHRVVSVPNVDHYSLNPHLHRQRIEYVAQDIYCFKGWRDVQIIDASKASADGAGAARYAWALESPWRLAWGTCMDKDTWIGVERDEVLAVCAFSFWRNGERSPVRYSIPHPYGEDGALSAERDRVMLSPGLLLDLGTGAAVSKLEVNSKTPITMFRVCIGASPSNNSIFFTTELEILKVYDVRVANLHEACAPVTSMDWLGAKPNAYWRGGSKPLIRSEHLLWITDAGDFREVDLRMNKITKKLHLSVPKDHRYGHVLEPIEGRALSCLPTPNLPATVRRWDLSGVEPKFAIHNFPIHFDVGTACLSPTQFVCVPNPIPSFSHFTIAIFDIAD